MVRMLDPSAPVTIYKNEKAGELHPITGESVYTIQQTKPRKQCRDPALIEGGVELLLPDSPELKPSDKEKLLELLYNFSEVDANDLGQTTLVQHETNTGDATPIHQPPRRLPFHQRHAARELVSEMLQHGVVEPSKGPWSSPIMLAMWTSEK